MADASERLSREAWLRAALETLEKGGIDAVKILPLSRALGASRGSFYWHFRDRADLLDSLLAYWVERHTGNVIERSTAAPGDASERLFMLMQDVLEHREGRYDPAIRAWALYDRKAAAVVRRTDRKRLGYVTGLFREMGYDDEEATARGRLSLLYLLGDYVVLARETRARRRELLRLRHGILTGLSR